MGMGKGMGMMSGKGKFCKNFDFDDSDDEDADDNEDSGKGMGKGMRMGMGMGKGMGMSMGMGGGDSVANCSPTVFEEASTISSISTFVSALELVELDDIFDCVGPFTMLAPVDTAFNQTVMNYFQNEDNADVLTALLLYHILPGLSLTDDFSNGQIDTLLDDTAISVSVDPITFNDVISINESNIAACNGAIQVISDILFPEGIVLFFRLTENWNLKMCNTL
jgi:uncharacterized surface protein with fasciclin (FAS1) repeats